MQANSESYVEDAPGIASKVYVDLVIHIKMVRSMRRCTLVHLRLH